MLSLAFCHSVNLSVILSVYMSVCPSFLSVCCSVCSLLVCHSHCLSIICFLSIWLSVSVNLCKSVWRHALFIFIFCLSVLCFVYLSAWLSACLLSVFLPQNFLNIATKNSHRSWHGQTTTIKQTPYSVCCLSVSLSVVLTLCVLTDQSLHWGWNMSKKTVLDSCCIADLCRSLSAPTSCIELLELSFMQETAQECSKSLERFMWERGWLRASGSAWILFIPASWESWLDRLTSTDLLDTQPAHTHTCTRVHRLNNRPHPLGPLCQSLSPDSTL